ncbi:MAG: hypothetical protein PUI49_02425 [Prevotellaceae bacterium]|nr:hypothetical protein [Prevotellaceae bacterium]
MSSKSVQLQCDSSVAPVWLQCCSALPSLFLRYEVDHNSIVDWRNSSVTLESQWSNTIGINLGRTLCPP